MSKLIKRIGCLVLVLGMILSFVPVKAIETNIYDYDDAISVKADSASGEFNFGCSYDYELGYFTYTYDYDDNYFFEKDAYSYNYDLALMSLKLSLASGQTFEPTYLKAIYDNIGFTYTDASIDYQDPVTNYDYEDESKDTVGYALAYKNVEYDGEVYTIVSISIRGFYYEQEWGNNFVLGTEGNAKGFNDSAVKVYNAVMNYLDGIQSTHPVKLWVTSYSRGAAIANVLGHLLNEKESKYYKPEDTYVYTFSTPNTTLDATSREYTYNVINAVNVDDNIFNTINATDLITLVPMKAMGFTRYGKDVNYPCQVTVGDYFNSDVYKHMVDTYIAIFGEIIGKETILNENLKVNWRQVSEFNSFTYGLSALCNHNREDYVTTTNMQEFLRFFFPKIYVEQETLDRVTFSTTTSFGMALQKTIDVASLMEKETLDSTDYQNIVGALATILAGENISIRIYMAPSDESEVFYLTRSQLKIILGYVIAILDIEDQIPGLALLGISIPNVSFDYENLITNVAATHCTEYSLTWLQSSSKAVTYSKYYELVVNSNVNVIVKYKDKLVAKYANGEINENYTGIEYYISDVDAKVHFLIPYDENYNYRLSITEIGNIEATVSLKDLNTKETYQVNSYKLINQGTNTLLLGSFKNGITLKKEYTVVEPISIVQDYSKIEATVTVINNNKNMGSVSKGGTYNMKDYVTLNATASSNKYAFDGYYYNDVCVSHDPNFTFRVDQNLVIVAKFKALSSIEIYENPKLNYLEAKDKLDLSTGKLKLTFDNGTSEIIALDAKGVSVSGFDNTKVGSQELKISYGSKEAKLYINIIAKEVDTILVKKLLYKYKIGDKIDLTSALLTVNYNNDTSEDITITEEMIIDFDSSTLGKKEITIEYKSKQTTFAIEILNYRVGDLNNDDVVSDADAILLLMHTFFPSQYGITQPCDFNNDSELTDADAIHLLMYTFFPEEYPLY